MLTIMKWMAQGTQLARQSVEGTAMTMETYHWERKHQSDPPLSVSIMRTLPEGDWTVRSEETTLPPEFPTRYDTLKAAMAAADEMAARHFHHECGERLCGQWVPMPPAHDVAR